MATTVKYLITVDKADAEYAEQILRSIAIGCREPADVEECKAMPTRRRSRGSGE